MLGIIDLKSIIQNLIVLAAEDQKVASSEHLSRLFRNYLRKVQPSLPCPEEEGISILWKESDIRPLLAAFQEESSLNDFDAIFDEEKVSDRERLIGVIGDAIEELARVWPDFSQLMQIVIHTIFIAPSSHAGGGSTTSAIGCIWADWRLKWTMQDYLEFFVHETTHNLMFVDELRHGHYSDYASMAQEENYSPSAILHRPRPLDKVLHSIVVAASVLWYREKIGGHPDQTHLHPPSPLMLSQTKKAIEAIEGNLQVKGLLTSRGSFLLERSWEALQEVSLEQELCV